MALSAASGVSFAAKQTQPPSWDLQAQAGHRLVIGAVKSIDGANVTFEVVRRVMGDSSDATITVAFDDATVAKMGVKGRYLVGYTDIVKKRVPAEGFHKGKPRVVRNLLAGEILSGASPAAIEMLDGTAQRKLADTPQQFVEFLLARLESSDPFLQRLASAELLGRASLMEQIDDNQIARIWMFVANVDRDPMARTIALRIGFARDGSSSRARTTVRELLATTPVSVVRGDMYWPGLVYTSLVLMADQFSPSEKDLPALTKWMEAEHRGVVEAALRGVGKTHPERELTEIYRVLSQPFLAAQARQILQQRVQGLSKR
ncbi:MAG: hypothetical protein AB8B96_21430 [Lysobacterales bacterium]